MAAAAPTDEHPRGADTRAEQTPAEYIYCALLPTYAALAENRRQLDMLQHMHGNVRTLLAKERRIMEKIVSERLNTPRNSAEYQRAVDRENRCAATHVVCTALLGDWADSIVVCQSNAVMLQREVDRAVAQMVTGMAESHREAYSIMAEAARRHYGEHDAVRDEATA